MVTKAASSQRRHEAPLVGGLRPLLESGHIRCSRFPREDDSGLEYSPWVSGRHPDQMSVRRTTADPIEFGFGAAKGDDFINVADRPTLTGPQESGARFF